MRLRALGFWMLAVAGLGITMAQAAYGDELVVKTTQGVLHGKAINNGRVRAFLGVPYAAPPVGDLRWRAPEPPARWTGERDATRFGAHCFQQRAFDDMVFQDAGPSEDCLFLNVYAPADAASHSKLPVMFWIHGGGYAGGASSEPRHNGDFLPLKGVVLVTINYRLGAFGFLATSELAREQNGSAGNYALMDMVAALHWVKENIAGFGGDPGNVTIFGESAGSFAVSTLMAMPSARGLFHKAIGESGGAFTKDELTIDTLAVREKKDDRWVAGLGAASLKDLRALPAERILQATRNSGGVASSPCLDGAILRDPVSETYALGQQAHVPLLAGWNRDEGGSDGMNAAKWKAAAEQNYKERAAEFLRLYPGDTDEQAARSAADYHGDLFIAFGTWKWIEAHRKTGEAPIYRYHFELPALPSKYHPGTVAFHSDDIEYVFGTLDTRPGETVRPEDRRLSEQMMSYWTNFAKSGDPNGPGLPAWPRYAPRYELIHLDSVVTSGPDTLRPRYEFLMKGVAPEHF